MSLNLRYPNITGLSEKEQLAQIKSYLHQLVEQLNNSLPTLGTGESASQPAPSQSDDISYAELRSFVIQELQEMDGRLEKYVTDAELPLAIKEITENMVTDFLESLQTIYTGEVVE